MTCHLIETANQTETEINLLLAKHVAKKVRINGEESSSLPTVIQNSEKESTYFGPFGVDLYVFCTYCKKQNCQ